MSIIPYKKVVLKSKVRLELIDDESKFDNLSTSIYTSELDSTLETEYSSWFNHFNSQTPKIASKKNILSWVATHYKAVEKYMLRQHLESANINTTLSEIISKHFVQNF